MSTLNITAHPHQITSKIHIRSRILREGKGFLVKLAEAAPITKNADARSGLRLPLELENPFNVPTSTYRNAIR